MVSARRELRSVHLPRQPEQRQIHVADRSAQRLHQLLHLDVLRRVERRAVRVGEQALGHRQVDVHVGLHVRRQRHRAGGQARAHAHEQIRQVLPEQRLLEIFEDLVVRAVQGLQQQVRRNVHGQIRCVDRFVTVGECRKLLARRDDEAVVAQRRALGHIQRQR
jgi:hypothetical protein